MIQSSLRLGCVMDKVTVDLKNCYGIKALKTEFDFSGKRAYAIYAPNGVMKTSFARRFKIWPLAKKPWTEFFQDEKLPDYSPTKMVTKSLATEFSSYFPMIERLVLARKPPHSLLTPH